MMKTLTKTLVLALLIATAWSYPQESDYEDYDNDYDGEEEEVVEYSDPPEFLMDSQHLRAKEGETVILPCQLAEEKSNVPESTSSPYVLIVKKAAQGKRKEKLIFVGDMKILRDPDNRYTLKAPGQVEISTLKRRDGGTYVCSLESEPPKEIKHVLDIQYAPKITAVTQGEQRVHRGGSVKLECEATGNPLPIIKWAKQDGHLPSGAVEEEGRSLTLSEVNRHVEGKYVCTADNEVGDPVSQVMSVVVEYQPEIITEKEIVGTDDGDTVELVCIVHARPAPTIEWTKDGAPIAQDSHLQEQQNGGHRNSIRITQISEADFGDYVCTAQNKFGVVDSTISMSGKPKPPHFTSDRNGGEESSYTLTWDTESYYPITEYNLKYRKAKANDSTDEPGDWMDMNQKVNNLETKGMTYLMKHKLDDLESATDYTVSVKIKNKFTWGDSAEFAFSTRKEVAQPTKISGASSVGFNALLLLVTALLLRT